MVRPQPLRLFAAVSLIAAGGAGLYALGATSSDGCPRKKDLRPPTISFEQAETGFVTVTVHNPNRCYGFRDEPIDISIYGTPDMRRAISYYADGAPHSDVGVCCRMTLPPQGTWSIRLGSTSVNRLGKRELRICNIRFELPRNKGDDALVRMPEGGAITGRGSFPPDFTPKTSPPRPYEPSWHLPCETPRPSPQG